MMRYKTRRLLAAALVNELVDMETRIKSNIRGRGKPKGHRVREEEVFSGVSK